MPKGGKTLRVFSLRTPKKANSFLLLLVGDWEIEIEERKE